jgi:hypothetical protein
MDKRLEKMGRRMEAEAYRYVVKEKVKIIGSVQVLSPNPITSYHSFRVFHRVTYTHPKQASPTPSSVALKFLRFLCNFGPGRWMR